MVPALRAARSTSATLKPAMTAVARAICQALLDHRHRKTTALPPARIKHIIPGNYTIAYGDLCAAAAVPISPIAISPFLLEIAQWCDAAGIPPLNSLAVNAQTGIPGASYDGAGGFRIVDWPRDVDACIRFGNYPAMSPH